MEIKEIHEKRENMGIYTLKDLAKMFQVTVRNSV
jgi:hypothetical protein